MRYVQASSATIVSAAAAEPSTTTVAMAQAGRLHSKPLRTQSGSVRLNTATAAGSRRPGRRSGTLLRDALLVGVRCNSAGPIRWPNHERPGHRSCRSAFDIAQAAAASKRDIAPPTSGAVPAGGVCVPFSDRGRARTGGCTGSASKGPDLGLLEARRTTLTAASPDDWSASTGNRLNTTSSDGCSASISRPVAVASSVGRGAARRR